MVGFVYFLLWRMGNASKFPGMVLERTVNEFWRSIYIVAINFFLFEYVIPQCSRKKILRTFFLIISQFFIYSVGLYIWRSIGIGLHIYTELIAFKTVGAAIAYHMPVSVASIFFFAFARHLYHYIALQKIAQQLKIEKQEAELNYLKSQTNPHFLFNTLNNIYSLARDKSDLAPESILRLSKILRFMLYEAGGAFIAIEQELKIITDYIALESLRYDESLRVNYNYDVEDMKQALPPLLLIPLVENAFKHGVSESRSQPFVDIHLSIRNRHLKFVVKNSSENFAAEENINEHIGLSNLRRQLELLYTDYDLSVQQSGSVFTATLIINLSSHA